MHGNSFIDELVLFEDSSGDYHYYLQDFRYTVYALVDNLGAIEERYRFDPYGKRTVVTDDGSIDEHYGFTGRYHDDSDETDLIYFRNRWMSGEMGRFINRDPFDFVEGMNFQAAYFVVNGLDPLGLWNPFAVGGAIIGAAIGGISGAVGAIIADGDIGDVLTAAGAGAVGGAVTGALLGSGAIVNPALAFAAGGAVSGAINGVRSAAKGKGEICSLRGAMKITASTTIHAGIGAVGGHFTELLPGGFTIVEKVTTKVLIQLTTTDVVVEAGVMMVGTAVTTYAVTAPDATQKKGTETIEKYIKKIDEEVHTETRQLIKVTPKKTNCCPSDKKEIPKVSPNE